MIQSIKSKPLLQFMVGIDFNEMQNLISSIIKLTGIPNIFYAIIQ